MTAVVFRSSRGWGLYGAIVSLCFIGIGCYFLNHPHGKITALAPAITVASIFWFLASAHQIIKPPRFEISNEGFLFYYMFFKMGHSWSEVDDVWLAKRLDYHLLVWRLKKRAIKSGHYNHKDENAYDGALPIWWRSKQTNIALKMIEAHEQYERGSKKPF